MKVLLNSFHLNGHTLGFHPQTEKLKPPWTGIEVTVLSFTACVNCIPLSALQNAVYAGKQSKEKSENKAISVEVIKCQRYPLDSHSSGRLPNLYLVTLRFQKWKERKFAENEKESFECKLIVSGPVQTTPEKFENGALFLRLRLLSTLFRHEVTLKSFCVDLSCRM